MKGEFLSGHANALFYGLAAVLGVALLLRVCGIAYGLPFVYWTDEYHEVMRALELGAGGFNLGRTGKGGFYLLLFVEFGLYFVALKIAGVVGTTKEFAELFARDPTMFYLMGRVTAALLGCATIAAAYWLGRLSYRATVGLLAAWLLAINVLHADLSHRVGVDVPMTFFATLSLCFGVKVATGGGRKDYLLAGLFAALATTTKLPGILVLLPLLAAHFYRVASIPRPDRKWVASRDLWFAVALFFSVWIATNPGIVVASDMFALFRTVEPVDPAEISEEIRRPNLWLFYLNVLRSSMGWPAFLVSLGGIAYAMWRRTASDVMLLVYAVVNYVAIASTTSEYLYFPRYALPIIVVLSILAARLVVDVVKSLPKRRMAIATVTVLILTALPLAQAMQESFTLTRVDTRTLAKEWIDAHVPAGSKVLIEGGKITSSRLSVPLEESRGAMQQRIEYWRKVEPRQAKYLQMKMATHAGGGYSLEFVSLGSIASLDEYVRRGVTYFVIRPDSLVGSRKSGAGGAKLLEALRSNSNVQMLKRFDAEGGVRPGPAIEIYEHMPGGNGLHP